MSTEFNRDRSASMQKLLDRNAELEQQLKEARAPYYEQNEEWMRLLWYSEAYHKKRIAELEPDAKAYRKLCEIRKGLPGVPCACEFNYEGDEILRWCEFHKEYRDRNAELERQLADQKVLTTLSKS